MASSTMTASSSAVRSFTGLRPQARPIAAKVKACSRQIRYTEVNDCLWCLHTLKHILRAFIEAEGLADSQGPFDEICLSGAGSYAPPVKAFKFGGPC